MDHPRELLISLENRCQYRCRFCVYLQRHSTSSISLSRWITILRQARELGIERLEIGGQGDPLLFKGFPALVHEAHRLGLRIRLLTNAQKIMPLLKVLPLLSEIVINMNATSPALFTRVHNPRQKNAFDHALANIARILNTVYDKKLKTEISVGYVIDKRSFRRAARFPQALFRILSSRFNVSTPLFVKFHHMLVVPGNDHLLPAPRDLATMLEVFDRARQDPFLRTSTNIRDLLRHTQKISALVNAIGPLHADTVQGTKEHLLATRLTDRLCCRVHQKTVFVDCDGNVFGCYNPTRIIYGLPAEEDPLHYGNITRSSLKDILKKTTRNKTPTIDLTSRFWKSCAVCGLDPA